MAEQPAVAAEQPASVAEQPAAVAGRRRVPDRVLLIALAAAVLVLLVTVLVGVLATRNPATPPLNLPTATSR